MFWKRINKGIRRNKRGESSKAPIQVEILDWRKIWAVDLMPKVKHFLWRLATNSLPWRKNIKRRGMQLDTICPVCWKNIKVPIC